MTKKKIMIILLIIAVILCLGIGSYAAYSYLASDIQYTKSDGTTVSVSAALDELRAGLPTKSIGDVVKVGGEDFYVLGWDNKSGTVELIAKYNLNSGGTAQSSSNVDTFFSTEYYWSNVNTSCLNDVMGYIPVDAIGKAKSYGISKGAVSSRLLTYEEVYALMNISLERIIFNGQNYWLGSAGGGFVWYVTSYQKITQEGPGPFNGSCNFAGVRPVIKVLKSSIS